jgi:CelD/BcsL family acetyltransferase involved in cellulose biosynthesis
MPSVGTALQTEVIRSEEKLAPVTEAWDALAVTQGRPLCAPAWMLAWWRHAAPRAAELRVVAVRDAKALIGIAPFFKGIGRGGRREYRLLGSAASWRIGLLAQAGREGDVAGAVAAALAAETPRLDLVTFEATDASSAWPRLMADRWPGALSPWSYESTTHSAPILSTAGLDFDDWLQTKSRSFRRQAAYQDRRLRASGAVMRIAETDDELGRGLEAFAKLHYARWSGRGGSSAVDPTLEMVLRDASRELGSIGRFRVALIDVADQSISAHVFMRAGGEVVYWAGGFDEAWARFVPGIQGVLVGIRDAMDQGARRIDFGPGGQAYKRRLADGDDPLTWRGFVPRTRRYPLARGLLAPDQAVWAAKRFVRSLPPPARDQIRTLRRRVWR